MNRSRKRSNPDRLIRGILVLLFAITPAVSSVKAAVPSTMSYQGILKNSSGNHISGTFSMQFKIYGASTGGTALWTETQSSVEASYGKFSVELGSVTPLNLAFDQEYWLSVKVGTDDEMMPRIKLTSVGYAYMAQSVVDGFSQTQHDALSHKNIEGVRENTALIAKTNFKLDAYALSSANSMGDMVVDTFTDNSGIHAASSSDYSWRGSPDYDVALTTSSGSVIQSSTTDNDLTEILSNVTGSYNGFGQRFRHSAAVTVDKVGFKWSKVGSPTGNVKIRIYSDSSGMPGTQLAESDNISVASISSSYPSYEEVTATLTSAVNLSANTDYHAVIENISASGDGSNHVNVKRSNGGNPYANGTAIAKSSGGTWSAYYTDIDTYFKVYEQASSSGSADVRSVAYTQSSAPTQAMVIPSETLNAGSITYYVSRDNGTTWTTCPKETLTSISSQPSGTQLKWRAVITGNAELEAIAVSI